jgi:hypothetical protein
MRGGCLAAWVGGTGADTSVFHRVPTEGIFVLKGSLWSVLSPVAFKHFNMAKIAPLLAAAAGIISICATPLHVTWQSCIIHHCGIWAFMGGDVQASAGGWEAGCGGLNGHHCMCLGVRGVVAWQSVGSMMLGRCGS